MEFFSRLTPFEERVWELVEGAFALGGRIAHQVSRATGDAAVGSCEALFSSLCESAPLSQSFPLSSSQDVEALASSALSQEQHTCEATFDEIQGLEQTQDISSGLVPESPSAGLAAVLSLLPPLISSLDVYVYNPQLAKQLIVREDTSDAQGLEQKHDASKDAVPAALDVELVPSALLASDDLSSLLYERGLCGGADGALPVGGEEIFEGEEGSGSEGAQEVDRAELSEAACRTEEVKGGEVACSDRAGGALGSCGREGSRVQDLDALCLARIMSCVGEASLRACSLVCRAWLDASNFARDSLTLRGLQQICNLPEALARFSDLRSVKLMEIGGARQSKAHSELDPPACLRVVYLRELARGCPRLLSLTLMRCGVISDEGLAVVLRGCSQLKTLHMSNCQGFSGAAFENVRCRLESLCLLSCTGLTNSGLTAMAEACPALRDFEVRMEGARADLAAGLREVAWLCPKLEKLFVQACGATDATLRNFAVSCRLLADVCVTHEPGITDIGVRALRLHLPRLDSLTLLNNDQLVQVPCSGRYLKMKKLEVGHLSHTPDEHLRELAKEVNLESLRIISCPALTDATVRKILVDCRLLSCLVIGGCRLVTSDIFRAYLESGSQARLEILSCRNVHSGMMPKELRLARKIIMK